MELGKDYKNIADKVCGGTSNEEFLKLVKQVRNMEKAHNIHVDNMELKGKRVYPNLNYVDLSVISDDDSFTLKDFYEVHKNKINTVGIVLLIVISLFVLKLVLMMSW